MNENYILEIEEWWFNDNDFLINKNVIIDSMISILKKEWFKNYEYYFYKKDITFFDFIKLQILVKIIYLFYINNIDLNLDIIDYLDENINNKMIKKNLILSLMWKRRKISIWKNFINKYWFIINLNKDMIFFKDKNDFLLEINFLVFINSFPKILQNNYWEYQIKNKFFFNLSLDNSYKELLDNNYTNMKENIRVFNENNGWNYIVEWNFKDWLINESSKFSWYRC